MTKAHQDDAVQHGFRELLRDEIRREAVIDKRGAQKRVAERAGLSPEHLSRILREKNPVNVSLATVTNVVSRLGVEPKLHGGESGVKREQVAEIQQAALRVIKTMSERNEEETRAATLKLIELCLSL